MPESNGRLATAPVDDGPDLLLASRSPRRRELLHQIGVRFETVRVLMPEQPLDDESPEHYVGRVALGKAQAGWETYGEKRGLPVLGADTAVIVTDAAGRPEILGKPRDRADGLRMLMSLSGRSHEVLTGVAVLRGERRLTAMSRTEVRFRQLRRGEAEAYWETGEPHDKAGGYAAQGYAAAFIEHLAGSYTGVVGLPLCETEQLLAAFDIPLFGVD